MSGSFGGWIYKNSPIPITKKPDLNDPVLRAKLAKGMGHNYYGEPAWPNDLLYIFPVVILGTIACNVGLAVLEPSMIGEPADPFATPLEILPEWYFFPVFQILRTVPNKLLGVLLMVSVPAGLLTVPFLENVNKFQNPFRRPVATTVFFIGTAVALWLGIEATLPIDKKANHTWDIESCPPTIVPLGCKWVYSVKVRSDGSLDRYKARLVALGNNQEYGVNYEETFAPVAKMTTVRTILALAASSDWPLHQMDVKNAFLHGDLKECIYMKPPPGLFPSPTSHVCKLRRSLYGLKQAPRAWFDKFHTILLQFSFRQSKYNTSLFLRKSDMGIVVHLVYVDDIVITGFDFALLVSSKLISLSPFI